MLNLSATSTVAGGRGARACPASGPSGGAPCRRGLGRASRVGNDSAPTMPAVWPGSTPPSLPARSSHYCPPTRPAPRRPAPDRRRGRGPGGGEWSDTIPLGSVGLIATVAPDRLVLEAKVAVVFRDEPVRSLTLGLTEPVAEPAWRFFDELTGQELPHEPVNDKDRAQAGDLGRGPAWQVDLPHPQRGRIALTARYEGRWDGHGRIPLVVLPAPMRARGTLLVVASRTSARRPPSKRRARPGDDCGVARRRGQPGRRAGRSQRPCAAHAWAYEAPSAWVDLRAEALAPADTGAE